MTDTTILDIETLQECLIQETDVLFKDFEINYIATDENDLYEIVFTAQHKEIEHLMFTRTVGFTSTIVKMHEKKGTWRQYRREVIKQEIQHLLIQILISRNSLIGFYPNKLVRFDNVEKKWKDVPASEFLHRDLSLKDSYK